MIYEGKVTYLVGPLQAEAGERPCFAQLYVLGKVVSHMHVIEFRKRGLPHAHILIILANNDRSMAADEVD